MSKLSKQRKRQILLILCAILVVALALWFVPFPQRVQFTMEGGAYTEEKELLTNKVSVTVDGWYLHYLFRGNTLRATVTLDTPTSPNQSFTYTIPYSTYIFHLPEPTSPVIHLTEDVVYQSAGSAYIASTNSIDSCSLYFTEDFSEFCHDYGTGRIAYLIVTKDGEPENGKIWACIN